MNFPVKSNQTSHQTRCTRKTGKSQKFILKMIWRGVRTAQLKCVFPLTEMVSSKLISTTESYYKLRRPAG